MGWDEFLRNGIEWQFKDWEVSPTIPSDSETGEPMPGYLQGGRHHKLGFDLIKKLTLTDDSKRYTIEKALKHPFVSDVVGKRCEHPPSLLDFMEKNEFSKNRWRKEEVKWVRQLSEHCKGLKDEFYRRYDRCTNTQCRFNEGGMPKYGRISYTKKYRCGACRQGIIVPLPPKEKPVSSSE